MDNDDATIGTILSRRQALSLFTRTGVGLTMGTQLLSLADAANQDRVKRDVRLVASPALTEGPFFVEEKLNRSDLRAGSQRPSVLHGVPLVLGLKVLKLRDGKFSPLPGATIDIWHADAAGVYSDESNPMNHEDTAHQAWLRGYQLSDSNGMVRFKTIFPGWYEGRTAHIHFKIRVPSDKSHREFTSQLFFDDHLADLIFAHSPYLVRDQEGARNSNDNIFGEPQEDGSVAGDHLTLKVVSNSAASGYRADFAIALTDHSFSTRRAGGPGGRGGPPPGPPPGDDWF